ncbi:hypothetical protein I3271_11915 [Photobacterium leiognathi]|uniref:hypothetical protein n=1 Tax=Photobacterium leiognathi TaxID=553611 RepID=UPI001EDEF502|nr:hypothetical protein [Photobacterium leiognathi]MCG3885379.1 hypothetical protein [Photobacterium leiognathi]
MEKNIAYGFDLAKDLIQICVIKSNKVPHNIEITSLNFLFGLLQLNRHESLSKPVQHLIIDGNKLKA